MVLYAMLTASGDRRRHRCVIDEVWHVQTSTDGGHIKTSYAMHRSMDQWTLTESGGELLRVQHLEHAEMLELQNAVPHRCADFVGVESIASGARDSVTFVQQCRDAPQRLEQPTALHDPVEVLRRAREGGGSAP